jgi:Tfp pilus assembly protein PilN
MRTLDLDYQAAPGTSWLSMLVLISGIALSLAILLPLESLTRDRARLEADLAAAQGRLDQHVPRAAAEPAPSPERKKEIAAANTVIRQLSLPWHEMFDAFELAANDEIALLGIEPDARKRLVKVTAESKSADAMLDYVKRLQDSGLLDDVFLQKHELQTKDQQKPLRFVVTSAWKDGK